MLLIYFTVAHAILFFFSFGFSELASNDDDEASKVASSFICKIDNLFFQIFYEI